MKHLPICFCHDLSQDLAYGSGEDDGNAAANGDEAAVANGQQGDGALIDLDIGTARKHAPPDQDLRDAAALHADAGREHISPDYAVGAEHPVSPPADNATDAAEAHPPEELMQVEDHPSDGGQLAASQHQSVGERHDSRLSSGWEPGAAPCGHATADNASVEPSRRLSGAHPFERHLSNSAVAASSGPAGNDAVATEALLPPLPGPADTLDSFPADILAEKLSSRSAREAGLSGRPHTHPTKASDSAAANSVFGNAMSTLDAFSAEVFGCRQTPAAPSEQQPSQRATQRAAESHGLGKGDMSLFGDQMNTMDAFSSALLGPDRRNGAQPSNMQQSQQQAAPASWGDAAAPAAPSPVTPQPPVDAGAAASHPPQPHRPFAGIFSDPVSSLDAFAADIQNKRTSAAQQQDSRGFLGDSGSTLDAFTAEILAGGDAEASRPPSANAQPEHQAALQPPRNAFGIHFEYAAATLHKGHQGGDAPLQSGANANVGSEEQPYSWALQRHGTPQMQPAASQPQGSRQEACALPGTETATGARTPCQQQPVGGSPAMQRGADAQSCGISPIPLRLESNGGLAHPQSSQPSLDASLFRSDASLDAFAAGTVLQERAAAPDNSSNGDSQRLPDQAIGIGPKHSVGAAQTACQAGMRGCQAGGNAAKGKGQALGMGLTSLFPGGTSAEALDSLLKSLRY